ncbi:helix-turn-helix transcriptional regulator [Miltoncostaea marina]|uniref:helix-turn-helix transcriptional regulator n=1 Tax=Miltoncostaea marina TaxID=2843215 RepID=UPI001C3D8038|nr:YafY family protein [Miltoncostaea marina]
MSSTSSRLLDLLALLQARRDWPGGELARRLDVSPRTIRRDVERLRALGYPVESLTGPAGCYRLRAGTAMPPLLVDEEEAIAIAVGLRTAARASVTGIEETAIRALVKLEQVLPAHLRRRVAALGAATVAAPPGGPTVDPQHLTVIAAACRDGECLRFRYEGRDGARSRREVEPHSLVNRGRRWYLVAWDRRREAWRTFRLDRLADPVATGSRFSPRPLPAGDAAAFVEGGLAAGASRLEARVTVHAPAGELAARHPHLASALTPIDERRCEYRTSDDDVRWLAMRIVALGAEVDVHEPPELVEHLRDMARRLLRAAGEPG